MNREQAKELLPIIQAWVDGKKIQFNDPDIQNSSWITFDIYDELAEPNWDCWNWRIKPEKKTGWINIYCYVAHNGTYKSKEEADRLAAPDRIACIQITYEEGEGL